MDIMGAQGENAGLKAKNFLDSQSILPKEHDDSAQESGGKQCL